MIDLFLGIRSLHLYRYWGDYRCNHRNPIFFNLFLTGATLRFDPPGPISICAFDWGDTNRYQHESLQFRLPLEERSGATKLSTTCSNNQSFAHLQNILNYTRLILTGAKYAKPRVLQPVEHSIGATNANNHELHEPILVSLVAHNQEKWAAISK